MNDRCCCGCCSLSTGSTLALIFASLRGLSNDSKIEAIFGILINTELLLLISETEFIINPSRFVINIDTIEDFDVFHGIVLAALGLNAFWLAFAIFATTGNINQSHGRLTPFTFLTYLLSMFQFGITVYFAIKFQSSFSVTQEFFKDSVPTKTLTYLTLLCIYSGAGILIFINLFLAHVVEKRGKEIDHDYSALVLYVLSHMSRCSQMNRNDGMQQNLLPEAPPSYDAECPPYLPPQIFRRANESSGSSWSLSCEVLKEANAGDQVASPVSNSTYRSALRAEQLDTFLTRNIQADCQNVNVDTNTFGASPY